MNDKLRRILITGGAGFIGINLIRHLLTDTEHYLINLDKLTYASNLAALQDVADHPRYHFKKRDILDRRGLKDVFDQYRPDAVIHLAAETHVDRSINAPDVFVETNIVGTYRLLQVSREYFSGLDTGQRDRFRFLHVSTDEVYGSLGIQEAPFDESSPYRPRSPYAASKAASDHLVRAWCITFGLPVLVANSSNNYGPYQHAEKLIPNVVNRAIRGEIIPIYGDGNNVRDWLYVEDHVRALTAILERGRIGATYAIGGNNEQTNIELVQRICDRLDELYPPRQHGLTCSRYRDLIQFVADRPGHDFRYAIDNHKISSELGWHPASDYKLALTQTIRWNLLNPAG